MGKKGKKLAAVLLAAVLAVPAGVRGDVSVLGAQVERPYGKLSYDMGKPVELVPGETVSFQVEEVKNKNCYFTFTIEETSKIEITGRVEGGTDSSLSWKFQNVYADKLYSKGVGGLDAVDAGTYYVAFTCTPNRLSKEQVLTISFTASSWGFGKGVDGKTTDNPFSLTVGKDCEININERYAARYTKFTLENDTVLAVQGKIAEGYSEGSMRVYNEKGTNITLTAAGVSELKLAKPGEWSEVYRVTLKAGTYFLGANWRGHMDSTDFVFRTEILKETDNTPPAKPTKLVYKAGEAKVAGNGEKNATVFVRVGDTVYTGKVSSKGAFSVKTKKLAKGDVVYVWVMDQALNQGRYSKVTVK